MGCCWHYHGPANWEDVRELEYELSRRRRERPDRETDELRELRRRQGELEAELADLRERISHQAS